MGVLTESPAEKSVAGREAQDHGEQHLPVAENIAGTKSTAYSRCSGDGRERPALFKESDPMSPAVYDFHFSLDVGKAIPGIGHVIDEVNNSIQSFGFDEKMSLRSQAISSRLSGVRVLTPLEIDHTTEIILSALREKLPQYDIRFDHKD